MIHSLEESFWVDMDPLSGKNEESLECDSFVLILDNLEEEK